MMKTKLLSSTLVLTLLWQTLYIPQLYAQPIEDSYSTQSQEYQAEMEDFISDLSSQGRTLWKEMEDFELMLNGSEEELTEVNDLILASEKFNSRLSRQKKNDQGFSVLNFMRMLYLNEDKDGKYSGFLTKGFNHPYNFSIPFEHEVFQTLIDKALAVQQLFANYISTRSISDEEKSQLALYYTIKIYANMEAFFAFFADDKKNENKRIQILNQLRPSIPSGIISDDLKEVMESNLGIKVYPATSTAYSQYYSPNYILGYTPKQRLKAQISALLSVPSSQFYLKAARAQTIENMLYQLYTYNSILGDTSPIQIPSSCREKLGNNFPSTINFDLPSKEEQKELINALLFENGHIFYENADETDPMYEAYKQYYMEYAPADLYYGGFAGLMPHEEYFASQAALGLKAYDENLFRPKLGDAAELHWFEPVIDDIAHFNQIMGGKFQQVQYVLQQHKTWSFPENPPEGAMAYYVQMQETYNQLELLIKNLVTSEELTNTENIYDLTGLNQYLVNKMNEAKATYWEEIVPEKVIEEAQARKIYIEMPKFHSSDSWKKWALTNLMIFMENHLDADPDTYEGYQALGAVVMACNYSPNPKPPVCLEAGESRFSAKKGDAKYQQARQIMTRAIDYLAPAGSNGDYLGRVLMDYQTLSANYPFFQRLWSYIQGARIFPESVTDEWEYLASQMAENPWASLRLTHLMLLNDFETQEEKYPTSRTEHSVGEFKYTTIQENAQAQELGLYNYKTQEDYKEIAKILGIDQTLQPFHANRLLSMKERKAFWKNLADQYNESNFYLFNAVNQQQDKQYYELLRIVNDAPLFSPESVGDLVALTGNNISRDNMYDELAKVYDSEEYDLIGEYRQMYEVASNPDRVNELYRLAQEHFEKHGIESAREVKSQFLDLESKLKAPIYHQMLKEAAFVQKQKVRQNMETLCSYNEKDSRDDFSDLYVATTKAQTQIASAYSVELPKPVKAVAERMSDDDWAAFWWGMATMICLISFPLTGGASALLAPMLIGAAGFTGGFIAAAGLGLGALVASGLAIHYEGTHVDDANERIATRQQFQDLGNVNPDDNDDIRHSRFWMLLEIACVSQLIGQALRSVQFAARAFKAIGRETFKGLTKAAKLAKYRNIGRQIMTLTSKKILETYRPLKKFGKDWLAHAQNMLKIQLFAQVRETSTVASINRNFARTLSKYFDDSAQQFLYQLTRYQPKNSIAKLSRKVNLLQAQVDAGRNTFGTAVRNLVSHQTTVQRLERLTQQLDLAKTQQHNFNRLFKQVKNLADQGGDLGEFILKHADEISEVTPHLKGKPSEMLYHVFYEGMPPENTRLPILRQLRGTAPGLSTMNDRLLMQRIVSARNYLIAESRITEAGKLLGLGQGNPTKFKLRQIFDEIIDSAIENGDDAFSLLTKKVKLDDDQAKAVIQYFKTSRDPAKKLSSIAKMTPDEFSSLLKAGDAKVIAAFNNTPSNLLYSLEITRETSHNVIQALSKQGKMTLDKFEKMLNALRIRAISTDPKLLPEVMHLI